MSRIPHGPRKGRLRRRLRPTVQALEARELLAAVGADASFESVNVGSGPDSFVYDPTGTPWSFTSPSRDGGSGVVTTPAGISGNGSLFTNNNPDAPDGAQVAFIQDYGTISQTITGWDAGTYRISLDAAQRSYGGGQTFQNEKFQVILDGTIITTLTPTDNTYRTYTTPVFEATAGIHTLIFLGVDSAGGDNTAFLDDVQLVAVASPGVVVNDPGFEAFPLTGGSYTAAPSGTPWTFSVPTDVSAAGVSSLDSGYTSGNPATPEGTQVAYIQRTGTISQTIADWPTGSFQLSFLAAQRGNDGSNQDFAVDLDGQEIARFTPSGTNYRTYTTPTFAVTAGPHTLKFVGLDSAGGDNTVFLDQVAVEPVASSISLDTGVGANGSAYDGGYISAPESVQSDSQLDSYLADHPIASAPAFDAAFQPVPAYYYAWLADGPSSNWIGPDSAGQAGAALAPFVAGNFTADSSAPQGLFYYTTQFVVPAGAAPQLVGGRWATDNQALGIFLNGVAQPLGGASGFKSFTDFALDSDDFRVGLTTLTFAMFNEEYGGVHDSPTGLRVEGTIAMAAPATPAVALSALSGHVYDDANDDGRMEPGEPGVGGVAVTLTGTTDAGASVVAATTTGADGSYSFAGLMAGTYSLTEAHPAAMIDGLATPGGLGGTATPGRFTEIRVGSVSPQTSVM